eukprot:scaffold20725_cov111-Isochrysis_galbana.AAC.15
MPLPTEQRRVAREGEHLARRSRVEHPCRMEGREGGVWSRRSVDGFGELQILRRRASRRRNMSAWHVRRRLVYPRGRLLKRREGRVRLDLHSRQPLAAERGSRVADGVIPLERDWPLRGEAFLRVGGAHGVILRVAKAHSLVGPRNEEAALGDNTAGHGWRPVEQRFAGAAAAGNGSR